jgi:hypothetical protein
VTLTVAGHRRDRLPSDTAGTAARTTVAGVATIVVPPN